MSGADSTSRPDWAIRFVDVCKSFGDRNKRHTVLDRVSFSVPTGRTTVIAGGMGQRAQAIFAENKITVIVGAPAEAPEKLVADYLSGALKTGQNVCDH